MSNLRRFNVSSVNQPVFRRQIVSPLTTAAMRAAQIAEDGLHRTALDARLDTDQADALERYAACEWRLRGAPRSTDYTGDRVQSGRSNMTPIADKSMIALKKHAAIKRELSQQTRIVLKLFCLQQWLEDGAPSDAQLGLRLDPHTKNASNEWLQAVALAASAITEAEKRCKSMS